jgi:spore maturation protein SpmA
VMNLVVCVCGVVAYWALRLLRPTEQLATVSRFAGAVSTTAIKITDRVGAAQPVFGPIWDNFFPNMLLYKAGFCGKRL